MTTYTKIFGVFVFAAILCIGQPWAFAQDVITVHVEGVTTVHRTSKDNAAFGRGAAYWTPERVREAKPLLWYDEDADTQASPSQDAPEGSAGSALGGRPSAVTNPKQSREAPAPDVNFGTQDIGDNDFVNQNTPDIGDNDFVNQNTTLWLLYPWITIGKLLITLPSGGSSYCTASVLSPNNIIVTAAHCCYDRSASSWNSNWSFIPAMREDTRPFGTFPWTAASVLTAWITQGGRQNDVCVLNLDVNEEGQTVSSATGWLGRSWNFPIVQHHFAFGYPGNISDGQYKYECSAESYANCGSNSVYGMGCNMTFGSSGGPWIRVFKKYEAGAMNFVNSVVSGYDECTGTFGLSFNGARFTSANIVPLCNAAGC